MNLLEEERSRRAALREVRTLTESLRGGRTVEPRDLAQLAHAMQRAGRPEDSLRVLRRLLTATPRHLMGHFLTARAQEMLGRAEPAAEGYRLVSSWAPPWPDPWRRRAGCLRRLGRLDEARKCLEAYLARKPEDEATRRRLAQDYLKANQPALACRHLEWLASAGQVQPADLEALGLALERLGRSGEAAGRYEAALEADAGNTRAGLRLARLRFQRGEWSRCQEVCARLLARQATLEPALSLAADAAMRLGDLDRAQASLERLHRIHPHDPELRTRYAEVLLAAGDSREAARQLEPVVDRFPRQVRAALRLAEIRRQQGDLRRARDLFGRVLAADPGQPLALLRAGQLALEEGDPRASVQPLRRLVLCRPDNPRAHRELGVALHRAERPKDAREHLERALELDPDDAVASLELGHVLRDQGAAPAAKVAYQRVLALAAGTPEATRAAYELSHLEPRRATKEAPARGVVVPLRHRSRQEGLVAPPGAWKQPA